MTSHTKTTKQKTMNKLALAIVLVTLAVAHEQVCGHAAAEHHQTGAGQGETPADDQNSAQFAQPKRQYFIAPRIGRSTQPTDIWSSLEEASLISPGKLQATRSFPSPLLFLINNKAHMIRPRSAGGLLPQARIGRRASPSGLLPQPRVGRRSDGQFGLMAHTDGDDSGQPEVIASTLGDNSALSDAFEALVNGGR